MMTPAFAHGWVPLYSPAWPSITPVSEVTGTVMLPFPVSVRWTKKKLSFTGSPPGPAGTLGAPAAPSWWLAAVPSSPTRTTASAAPTMLTHQPRTVLNLVHSAPSNWRKPSRPGRGRGRYGVIVGVIAAPPRRRHGTP